MLRFCSVSAQEEPGRLHRGGYRGALYTHAPHELPPHTQQRKITGFSFYWGFIGHYEQIW